MKTETTAGYLDRTGAGARVKSVIAVGSGCLVAALAMTLAPLARARAGGSAPTRPVG